MVAAAQPQSKILVVDDDRDIAEWLNQLLKLHGYIVSKAFDGLEALEQVALDIPDLILMDLMMPRMDGPTAIKRLCDEEETCAIPVIVLSAHPPHSAEERKRMFGDSVRQIMQKPAPMVELVTEIKKALA